VPKTPSSACRRVASRNRAQRRQGPAVTAEPSARLCEKSFFGNVPQQNQYLTPSKMSKFGVFTQPVARADDHVWADLDDGEPANADLTALTQEMPVSCRDHTFTEFIDHIVVDRRVRALD
jgi:hypothetical protein